MLCVFVFRAGDSGSSEGGVGVVEAEVGVEEEGVVEGAS